MHSRWKVLFAIYNLMLLFIAGSAAAVAVGFNQPLYFLNYAFSTPQTKIISGSVSIIFIFLILVVLFKSYRSTSFPEQVDLTNDGNGMVSITIDAIKALILKAIKPINGIREVKSQVFNTELGISIRLHIVVVSDHNIPDLCLLTQKTVKEYLENTGGLKVAEVKIMVDDKKANSAAR